MTALWQGHGFSGRTIEYVQAKQALASARRGISHPLLTQMLDSRAQAAMFDLLSDNLRDGIANIHLVVGGCGTGKSAVRDRVLAFYGGRDDCLALALTLSTYHRHADPLDVLIRAFLLDGQLAAVLKSVYGRQRHMAGAAVPLQIAFLFQLAMAVPETEHAAFHAAAYDWLRGKGAKSLRALASAAKSPYPGAFDRTLTGTLISSLAALLRTKGLRLVLAIDGMHSMAVLEPKRQAAAALALSDLHDLAHDGPFDLFFFAEEGVADALGLRLHSRLSSPVRRPDARQATWDARTFAPEAADVATALNQLHALVVPGTAADAMRQRLQSAAPAIGLRHDNPRELTKTLVALLDAVEQGGRFFDLALAEFE